MAGESNANVILGKQEILLHELKRSHQLYLRQMYSSILSVPIWLLWIILLVFLAIPPEYFSTMLLVLFIQLPLWVVIGNQTRRQFEGIFAYFRSAEGYLKDAEEAVNASQFAMGLTSYVNLLFNTLPSYGAFVEDPLPAETQDIQKIVRRLKITPLIEMLTFFGVLIGFASFVFAYDLGFGTPQLFSLLPLWIVLGIAIILMLIRWVIFFYWRRTVNRWSEAVQGITAWGEALERSLDPNEGVKEGSS